MTFLDICSPNFLNLSAKRKERLMILLNKISSLHLQKCWLILLSWRRCHVQALIQSWVYNSTKRNSSSMNENQTRSLTETQKRSRSCFRSWMCVPFCICGKHYYLTLQSFWFLRKAHYNFILLKPWSNYYSHWRGNINMFNQLGVITLATLSPQRHWFSVVLHSICLTNTSKNWKKRLTIWPFVTSMALTRMTKNS